MNNEQSLFPSLQKLQSFFKNEERIVVEEIQSVTIRKNKTLIEGYVFYEFPIIIDTADLFIILDKWYSFVRKWKNGYKEIHSVFR